MYKAVCNVIKSPYIHGLQRVYGMWRIHIDSYTYGKLLMHTFIRNKQIAHLQTNLLTFDYENTVRIRLQNKQLSADEKTKGCTKGQKCSKYFEQGHTDCTNYWKGSLCNLASVHSVTTWRLTPLWNAHAAPMTKVYQIVKNLSTIQISTPVTEILKAEPRRP